MSKKDSDRKNSKKVYRMLIVVCALLLVSGIVLVYVNSNSDEVIKNDAADFTSPTENPDRIENGIHIRTGLVDAPGLQETVNNCTNCHSAKLVVQNRMSAKRWHETIRWMQETQNLWPLGENEAIIVDYLVTNYPPVKKGRRKGLNHVDWYELNP